MKLEALLVHLEATLCVFGLRRRARGALLVGAVAIGDTSPIGAARRGTKEKEEQARHGRKDRMKRSTKHEEAHAKRIDLMVERMRLVPEDAIPFMVKDTDLVVFQYPTRDGKPAQTVFRGRSAKPFIAERYKDEAQRARRLEELTSSVKRVSAMKQEQKEVRTSGHGMKVGDILYDSWGYDQTNVNFYEVTGVSGASVVVREIASKVVESYRGGEKVMPVPGDFISEPMKKRPSRYGKNPDQVSVKITSSISARPWDGKPLHQTAWGWGH